MQKHPEHNADVLNLVEDMLVEARICLRECRRLSENIEQLEQQLAGIAMRKWQLDWDADNKAIESLA